MRERAVGAEVSKALNPGQQVIKIVNEELIATLGEAAPLNLSGPKPRVIMLVGLQGSGKTTTAGKACRACCVRRGSASCWWRLIPIARPLSSNCSNWASGWRCRLNLTQPQATRSREARI